jgi:hypothetical protein
MVFSCDAAFNEVPKLKSITVYVKTGKKKRQIDLDYTHHGIIPHVHVGYEGTK